MVIGNKGSPQTIEHLRYLVEIEMTSTLPKKQAWNLCLKHLSILQIEIVCEPPHVSWLSIPLATGTVGGKVDAFNRNIPAVLYMSKTKW